MVGCVAIDIPRVDKTCKQINSLVVSRYSHWYQKTKGLKYPSKIDPETNKQNWGTTFCCFTYMGHSQLFSQLKLPSGKLT